MIVLPLMAIAAMASAGGIIALTVWTQRRSRRRNRKGCCAECGLDILGEDEIYLHLGCYICPGCAVRGRKNMMIYLVTMHAAIFIPVLVVGVGPIMPLYLLSCVWIGIQRGKAMNRRADALPTGTASRTGLLRALFALLILPVMASAQTKPRARDLQLPIGGVAGPLDAITDVAGVEVGHTTLISGSGRLVVGQGPVRTGVTVIHPRGKESADPVFGAWFTLNGNGEMTGTTWLQESGFLEGPVAITNTHSVGVVRDAILQWQTMRPGLQPWGLPVVAETYDGGLNDINGFHVKPEHVMAALNGATSGPVAEGNVGGGTGMICHQFKGGIGTASRVLPASEGGYTVGVLVQCNYGLREDLRVAGVPVGEAIPDLMPCVASADPSVRSGVRRCDGGEEPTPAPDGAEQGSIIVVVATDAPLLPHQLKRVVTRVALGVGRSGGFGGNSSGDIFVAFSTANAGAASGDDVARIEMLPNPRINPLFYATVQATEEAIVNALLAAETMIGANDLRVFALPVERLQAVMRQYGR